MSSKCGGSESSYAGGCRCDLCKRAASDARRLRRQRAREAVGALPCSDIPRTPLVSITSPDTNVSPAERASCVDAVQQEIDSLISPRPGLAAVAVALAEILDNPKATSSKPAAANQLMRVLELLRKSSDGARRGRLAVVKSMTREQK